MVANLEWDPRRRVTIQGLLIAAQTNSLPQTTPLVVPEGGQKVPWVDSSPTAQVCLSCRGDGDLSDFREPEAKGRCVSTYCIGAKSQRERVWGLRENVDFAELKVLSWPDHKLAVSRFQVAWASWASVSPSVKWGGEHVLMASV